MSLVFRCGRFSPAEMFGRTLSGVRKTLIPGGGRSAQPSIPAKSLHTFPMKTRCPTLYNSSHSSPSPFPSPSPSPRFFQAFTATSSYSTKIQVESTTKEKCNVCQEDVRAYIIETYGLHHCPVCHSKWDVPNSFSIEKVRIETLTEYSAVQAPHSMSHFAVLIRVRTPSFPLPVNDDDSQRVPVDVVAVLNVSDSMYGPKLHLLQSAMNFLVDHMLPFDRLSLVTFSSTVQTILPLSNMTEKGRQDAKSAVKSLSAAAYGTVDFAAGLNMGAQVLEERNKLNDLNPVNCIMFLSDGLELDRSTGCPLTKAIFKSLKLGFPVHTFCTKESEMGSECDPTGMMEFANAFGGKSSEFHSVEMIPNFFAQVSRFLGGGLLSVAAERVVVVATCAAPGVKIADVHSWETASEMDSEGKLVVIDVGDLYPGEIKEFMLRLSIPKHSEDMGRKTPLLDIACSYQDVLSKDIVHADDAKVEILRPAILSQAEEQCHFKYCTIQAKNEDGSDGIKGHSAVRLRKSRNT